MTIAAESAVPGIAFGDANSVKQVHIRPKYECPPKAFGGPISQTRTGCSPGLRNV